MPSPGPLPRHTAFVLTTALLAADASFLAGRCSEPVVDRAWRARPAAGGAATPRLPPPAAPR